MRITIILIISSFISTNLLSQKNNFWITYAQSKFLYCPGIEFNSVLYKNTGLQAGFSAYILDYQPENIVSISNDAKFNFQNANIGLSQNFNNIKLHQFGVYLGLKLYSGPEFKFLHFYDRPIYYDLYQLNSIQYGADFGIYYLYKRITTLLKFDTARKKIRLGIGFKIPVNGNLN